MKYARARFAGYALAAAIGAVAMMLWSPDNAGRVPLANGTIESMAGGALRTTSMGAASASPLAPAPGIWESFNHEKRGGTESELPPQF